MGEALSLEQRLVDRLKTFNRGLPQGIQPAERFLSLHREGLKFVAEEKSPRILSHERFNDWLVLK